MCAQLRVSEEKLAKAFRASPDAISITTLAEGCYIEVSDSFLRLTGYERDEVIGHSSLELGLWVDPQDRVKLVEPLRRQGRVRDLEFRFRRKSGESGYALVSAESTELDGEPCLVAVARDLTDQKQVETELQGQREFLRKVIDADPNLVFVKDWEGRFTLANRAVTELCGTAPEELTGKCGAAFNPKQEGVENFLRERPRGNEQRERETNPGRAGQRRQHRGGAVVPNPQDPAVLRGGKGHATHVLGHRHE